MPQPKPLTEEQRRAILDRYARRQGLSYIAMALDISKARIKEVLVAAGVEVRKPGKRYPGNSWGWDGLPK